MKRSVSLADRIEARLAEALDRQQRANVRADCPGLAGDDGEVWITLAEVARIAAEESQREQVAIAMLRVERQHLSDRLAEVDAQLQSI